MTNKSNKTDKLDYNCRPRTVLFDDPDNHLGVPAEYTPLKNRDVIAALTSTAANWNCFEDQRSSAVDDAITRITEAKSDAAAKAIILSLPHRVLFAVADQLHINTEGHGT